MSHHTILAVKCVRDSVLQLTEKSYIHTPVKNLINIYQWKKLFHVKFEFLQNVDKISPVTLVRKGVTGVFKEEDDRLQKKWSEKGNWMGLLL